MKLVFMGTSEFARPTLRTLHHAGYDIGAVVTQPDRPAGRGLALVEPPVKLLAKELGLRVEQPDSLKESKVISLLRSVCPEIIVVVSYGLKLPREILDLPRHGCLNLHPSLLPRYRGAAPINWALINGEAETGISVIKMIPRMDAGDIVLQQRVDILPEENAGSLEARLSEMGAEMMLRAVELTAQGRADLRPQDEALATTAPKLRPQDRVIDWNRTSRQVRNLVRGLTPKPGAQTKFRGKILEIAEVREIAIRGTADMGFESGRVVGLDMEMGPLVRTADGLLALIRVKPEGKRLMSGIEFSRGYRPESGERLG